MTASPIAVAAADGGLRARITVALAASGLDIAVADSHQEALLAAGAPRLLVATCDPEDLAQRATLKSLADAQTQLRIVVVCEVRSGLGARMALERWVDGFVFADQVRTALGPTVVAVLAGQAVVPRRMRRLLRRPTLSFREKQTLALVALGCTNSQIGARLFLSESTVKSHLSSSFAKLGVRSRNDAAALVLDAEESRRLGIDQVVAELSAQTTPLQAVAR